MRFCLLLTTVIILFAGFLGCSEYIGVDDDERLSRRMGSFGARSHINAVTYTITSVKDIDCISLEIEEGDHAVPGEYCR